MTGIPNIKGVDETPYDYTAQKEFGFNVNGLDTEGLVRTKSGDLWLVDEYSPLLIHVDTAGKVVKRYVPAGLKLSGADYLVQEALPAILAKRKINRGFEGLAIIADEKTLYAVLQSPPANPNRKVGDLSRNTRVVVFDREREAVTAEYVYRFDVAGEFDPRPKMAPDEMELSGLVYLNPTTLLVLERTDWMAKLYAVDISPATNILKSRWGDPSTTPSLASLDDPGSAEIRVLPKSFVLNLNQFKEMPEKIEGIAMIDRNTIAVANDNDFDSEEKQVRRPGQQHRQGQGDTALDNRLGQAAAARGVVV